MKKLLIIDRDGTILYEPPVTFQIDTLEQFEFIPGVISALKSMRGLDYEMIMASNQDGLGTPDYPMENFEAVQRLMLTTLRGEGVEFDDLLIDPTREEDNAPTRKPRTGMFGRYLTGDYDLASSFVIGDRPTDVELAYNLGAKAILLQSRDAAADMLDGKPYASSCALVTSSWEEIARFVRSTERCAVVDRNTSETSIHVAVDLDGGKDSSISTGLGFFDHMLWQLVHHGGISLEVAVKGDLYVDEHHTIEDTAIALGNALREALGDKRGMERYGFVLPMDECDATVIMDLGGRIDFSWDVQFTRERIGEVPTEMFEHFFKSLGAAMQANLHISSTRGNEHHMIEGIYKAFARTLRQAIRRDVFSYSLPSSKGML